MGQVQVGTKGEQPSQIISCGNISRGKTHNITKTDMGMGMGIKSIVHYAGYTQSNVLPYRQCNLSQSITCLPQSISHLHHSHSAPPHPPILPLPLLLPHNLPPLLPRPRHLPAFLIEQFRKLALCRFLFLFLLPFSSLPRSDR